MNLPLRRPGKQPALRLAAAVDFTGGLNLAEDRFTLGENESPAMSNVDVQRRGGIQSRKTVQPWGDPEVWGLGVSRIFNHTDAVGGSPQLLVCNVGVAHFGTGGAWTPLSIFLSHTDHCQLNDVSYLVSNLALTYVWDGATLTAMTDSHGAYQNDYSVPSGSHAPKANVCAQHLGYVWMADIDEGGTRHPSRVRVSHPNDGGSWAEDDWVDIAVGDGEAIQRLIPFRDHLLVIKETSTWAIYGYDRSTFTPVQVSSTVGATNYHAVAASPEAVWIFSADRGLYAWDGTQMHWVFEKLYPALRDGDFAAAALDEVQVGWVRDRVWVRIEGANGDVATYPFDPQLGAWTKYDLDITTITTYEDSNGTQTVVASTGAADHIVALEQGGASDDFGDGAVDIESFYSTPWMDGGNPFVPKRWKRPEFVLRAASTHAIQVDVFQDYEANSVYSQFQLDIEAAATGGMLWGTGVWGTGVWGGSGGVSDVIERGGSIGGTGRALMFCLKGPTSVQWEVRGFTLKYRPKNPRS